MLTSLADFKTRVQKLREHIKSEICKEAFFTSSFTKYGHSPKSGCEEDLVKFISENYIDKRLNEKVFLYNSTVVTLYGCLESYLESLVKEYLENLIGCCNSFSDMPTKIQNSHLELSVSLLSSMKRYRTATDEKNKEIIANISSCLQADSSFFLNIDAYSYHASNFRYDSINELFSQVGIEDVLSKVVKNKETDKATLKFKLEDLAERRNQVSHGNETGEIESLELCLERIKYIEELGIKIYPEVEKVYLIFSISKNKLISLGKPSETCPQLNVLCFESGVVLSENRELKLGDELIGYNKNCRSTDLEIYKIKSMRLKGNPINSLEGPAEFQMLSLEIDLNVSDGLKKREFFLKQ